MNEFGVFLYESGISLSVLYIFYWFLLRKETYFSLNRIILVSTLLLALIIPFIRITITGHTEQGSIVYVFDRFIMDPLVVSPETVHAEKIQNISLIQIIYFIYFAGVIFFSFKFFVQFFQIFKLVKKYGTRKLLGYKIVPIDNNLSPFSFFNFIFINSEKVKEDELKNVLYHEGEHARRLHTIDIILLEIICIIQWFNPFIWLYKLALREIHEYEADLRVIKNGGNKLNYQQLILQQVFGNQFFQVVHHFLTNSLTKKRITMISKIKSKKRTIIKALFILPVATLLVMIFSFTRGTESNDMLDNFELIKNGERINPTEYFSDVEIDGLRTPLSITPQEQDTIVFETVEEPPSFSGEGYSGFRKFVMKELVYPEEAAENGTTGKVFVQFIVDAKGKVRDAKVLKVISVDNKDAVRIINAPLLEKEALKVVNSSTKWEPGKNKGKPVNVQMVMPIQFVLQGDKKQDEPVATGDIPEDIFFIVEEMPYFQNKGLNSFRDWVMKQLIYPKEAKEQGIEGIVYIQFVVNTKGDVTTTKIMREADPLLDAEAIRVVKSSPQWTPGKQRGQEVNVAFTFPVKFSLGDTEKNEPKEKTIPVEEIKQDEPVATGDIPEEIFFIVEEMPIFPHDSLESMDAFRNYVMGQLIYPEEAAKKGINGKVDVQFVVNKNGDVKNVKIKEGDDPLLNAEALRVIKSSPQWIPGKQRGQVVNVAFTFPIMFVTQ